MDKIKTKTHNFLRWTEKYTKTDMVYLTKGGFWLTAGQVVSSISVFILAITFANLLPKETYGIYKYILTLAGIISVLTLKGMNIATFQAVAQGFEGVFFHALKMKIKWGILATLTGLFVSFYYYINGNNTLAFSFLIIAGFLPLIEPFEIYHTLLQGKKLFNLSALYKSLSQIGSTIALIITVVFTQNLYILLFVYFTSWTLLKFIFLIITIKKHPPNKNYNPKSISYGKRASFVNMLDVLVSSIDGLLIFHYLGPINLAVYLFAIAPVSQIKSLANNIPTLVIPKLSVKSPKELNTLLKKRIILLFIIGGIASLTYIIIAPYIYQIFFPKYIDSIFFSQIFSLTMIIILPQTILGSTITSKLTLIPPKMLHLWNLPGIIFVVFALMLVTKIGIMGIIISRLLALTSGFIINIIIWKKIKNIDNN